MKEEVVLKYTISALLIVLAIATGYGCGSSIPLQKGAAASDVNRPAKLTAPPLNYGKPLLSLIGKEPLDKANITLKIEKSKYLLTILYSGEPIKAYPVVFGKDPVNDKQREGDSRTPEGDFALTRLYPHKDWTKIMMLNYPTPDSWRKFGENKSAKRIRSDATIGSAIGIHGVPAGHDDAVESRQNWTLGCISLKTADIEEVYSVCRCGTKVQIVH